MDAPRILVVDDEDSIRHVLKRLLEMKGCEVRSAGSAERAIEMVADWDPEVALLDIILPGKNGLQLLGELKQLKPDTEVLMMTSNSSAETALQAVRQGAFDYLRKPFSSLPDVWTIVQRALEKRNLDLSNRVLLEEQEQTSRELSSKLLSRDEKTEAFDLESVAEVLENFLGVVMRQLHVERASVMVLDPETGELKIAASQGLDHIDPNSVRISVGEGIAGKVAATGEPFLVTDAEQDERLGGPQFSNTSNSFISAPIVCSVPIKAERGVVGVMNVTNRKSGQPFNSNDVAFISGLARQLGLVLEGARRSHRLRTAYESLKSTQEQLVFSERVKAVGQMAAGVAHDFNNALAIILTRTQFVLGKLERQDPDLENVRNDLNTIVKTALQGAETIKRIQDYTKMRKDQPNSSVDLNAVIRDAVEIAKPKWKEEAEAGGRQIEVTQSLDEVPHVSGNVYELTQVVGNLIFNAVEAMPEGGQIALETEIAGETVIMRVRDTGTGMDDETQKRLFEPFFTTKETGQGLGTSIIHGIISRHHGEIVVDSELGKGTTFTVTLPTMHAEATVATAEEQAVAAEFVAARVLFVDDDEAIRETYEEALEVGGHNVQVVDSGQAAVDHCRTDPPDLVITDLSMTGMSGLELAVELKKMHADLPVILFSGWAVQELQEQAEEVGVDLILTKPCLIEDLLGAVQKVVQASVAV